MVTGRKLLLADDSVTIQKVVDLTFSDEGLEVVTVSDGQQALEKLEELTPDIVLADVFMPGMDGYKLCEHIKRTERLSHIPVMLLVGSFEPFDEVEARRVGADDYLTKPFQSIRTLIGKVRNLLAGGGSGAESSEQPTRQLAPPPEAEKENRPDTDFLERSTADTAPLPANAHEESAREGQAREISFNDLSMDDEMIETSPAGNYAGTEQSVQSKATAQYSAADLREAGITETVESEPAPQESVEAFASAQAGDTASAVSVQPQSAAPASGVASSEDALLDLGDMEPPPSMAEADDFLSDLLDDAPQPVRASAQPFSAAATPQVDAPSAPVSDEAYGAGPSNVEETAAAAASQAQEFVDGQVIEDTAAADEWRAPAEAEATPFAEREEARSWQESAADARSATTERLPEGFQFESAQSVSAAAETGATESTAPQAGQITLEQLSPEVIDAIARRAVEQLSERAVEQIAWEVVPQLAELLIKRRLEEEKK